MKSLWRILRAAAILGLPPAFAAPNTGIIQVTNVRAWSHADSTRVILETTGAIDYRADHAHNPERLFFDILHASPWIEKRRYATQDIGDKLVHRVRIAETAPGTTRIVFDLAAAVDFEVTKLEAPNRLVIELRPLAEPKSEVSGTGLASHFVYPPVSVPAKRPQVLNPPTPPSIPVAIPSLPSFIADSLTSLPPQPSAKPPIPRAPAVSTLVLPSSRPTADLPAATSATASQNASRSLTRALGLKVSRIVIDAGHGGHDDGTIGPHGVLEKDVVLDVALRLSKLVQQRMGAEVVLTRSDDTFIPLHERTAIANERNADLFLSIHANSSPAPEVAGTETFFLNFTNSPDALNVAARENAGAEKNVGELKNLIQTITLNDKIEESHTLAQNIQTAIQTQAEHSNAAAHNRGVKRAPFVVLIGASMPSVLAEIGFLSNSRDEANLGKPEYRQKIAEALYKGLSQYSQSLSHFEAPRQIAKTAEPKPKR